MHSMPTAGSLLRGRLLPPPPATKGLQWRERQAQRPSRRCGEEAVRRQRPGRKWSETSHGTVVSGVRPSTGLCEESSSWWSPKPWLTGRESGPLSSPFHVQPTGELAAEAERVGGLWSLGRGLALTLSDHCLSLHKPSPGCLWRAPLGPHTGQIPLQKNTSRECKHGHPVPASDLESQASTPCLHTGVETLKSCGAGTQLPLLAASAPTPGSARCGEVTRPPPGELSTPWFLSM